MSSLFFWFVYFTLDDVYKVKALLALNVPSYHKTNVFVNSVCDFNEFKFTEKGVCIIEFTLLGFRFLKLLDYDTS